MKVNKYTVVFVTGDDVVVFAGCEAAAKILAQAERIKAGLEWRFILTVRES